MVTASLALAALVTASSAFVVTPFSAGPHAIGYRAQLSTRVGCSKTRQSSSTVPIPDEEGNVLPPRDETFGPLAVIREALAAPGLPEGAKRFDRIGRETGGIWRSRILGFLPATVLAAPLATKWLTKQEGAGAIATSWPKSTVRILGEKALTNIKVEGNSYTDGRKIFAEALSPQAVLKLQPIAEASVTRMMGRLEKFAQSGEEFQLLDELNKFTLEVICYGFLGEYATSEILEEAVRLLPTFISGTFSIPRTFPWPLNRFPTFSFGLAMEARGEFSAIIADVLRQRRLDMLSDSGDGKDVKTGGGMDLLLKAQQLQIDGGGPEEGGITFDDNFIIDNVLLSLFAGYSTTAGSLARVVEHLGSADGKRAADLLMEEIAKSIRTQEGEVDDHMSAASRGKAHGIFEAFPLLDAVVLESSRLNPAVAGVFRKAAKDLDYNGYLIPAGQTIAWNLSNGYRAESLYPEPSKFCPFRFMHGDAKEKGDAPTGIDEAAPADQVQPRPQMFGFGKHLCPGRELSKLEILIFLRAFLTKFDYTLVEGQSFKPVLPTGDPKDKLRIVLKLKDQ